jgi:outer membrane protein
MSGPVIGTNNGGSVWERATGLLANWQPFDFGLRHTKVESAAAARDRANANVQRSQLEISSSAEDAFLTVLAAGQAQNAAQVAVDNWETHMADRKEPSGVVADYDVRCCRLRGLRI